MLDRKGQIWVETVIYTLIGLTLIGFVLAIVTPRINEFKDRAVIEQTIEALNKIDEKVNEVLSAPGNKRIIELGLKRGEIYFVPVANKVYIEINDSRSLFSESGVEIPIGRINVTTTEGKKQHSVVLSLYFSQNLTFEDSGETVKFSAAPIPYKFSIENKGFLDENIIIDVRQV